MVNALEITKPRQRKASGEAVQDTEAQVMLSLVAVLLQTLTTANMGPNTRDIVGARPNVEI